MAKKKAATKRAAQKSAPVSHDHEHEHDQEIELDPTEEQAFRLAQKSRPFRDEMETAVTVAISKTVRKVFKGHGVALSAEQAEKMAMILFGD